METKEKIYLTVGLFVLVASVGITYTIAEGDTAYYCEVENSVGLCFKLSKVNDAGFQTRCYYSEETPTKYNYCKSGWFVYEDPTVTGELIKVDDSLRVEKVGDVYTFWKKTGESTKEEILFKIENADSEILKIKSEEGYWKNNFYPACVRDCPRHCETIMEKDIIELCISHCPFECEFQRDMFVEDGILRISELNKEKEIFLEVIK